MIIDCYRHYTTASKAHHDWRSAQTFAIKTGRDIDPAYPNKSDDDIREMIEGNQLHWLKKAPPT